jgi:hypothetical protein
MKTYKVKLFEVAATPQAKPVQREGFTVDARNTDHALRVVTERLVGWGHAVRSVACSPGDTFVAYIHAKE